MNREQLTTLLTALADGTTDVSAALDALASWPGEELGYAHVDTQRAARTGHPEVIFGQGKSPAQIVGILEVLHRAGQDGLVTRVDEAKAHEVCARMDGLEPAVEWVPDARILRRLHAPREAEATGSIAVVCAGTSDLPVAEEAAVVAEFMGNKVSRFWDVGVAGIHRVIGHAEQLRSTRVIIVVAGMEGALASVVAGLVDKPVIAVPTSVGYGASFGGVAALLAMLNSCAAGVSVVNIDNGFGAAMQASLINKGA